MFEYLLPADSPLPGLLETHQKKLVEAWTERQLQAPNQRFDLIDEKTLARQCRELVECLVRAAEPGQGETLDSEAWKPMRDYLEEMTRARDLAGFSAQDTAAFVLSLKRPLSALVAEHLETSTWTEMAWNLDSLVNHLALFTTEVVQRRREETIERQRQEMEELSTPVVKVWDGILAMPLVGTLDTRRSQMVTEALLESLAATGSEIAILDLTGVPAVDTRMAQHLIRTVAAARLMGADCILCGIRPQIAQTIVHLQINLGNIVTEATLASALKTAFGRMGMQVAKR